MNVYLNLKPNNYDGESDLLTVRLASILSDDIMRYVRPIAENKQTTEDKILKGYYQTSDLRNFKEEL